MNNERYNQIIDEVYEDYCKNVSNEIVNVGDTFIDTKRNLISTCKRKEIGTLKKVPIIICEYEGCYIEDDCKKILSKEEFICKCKTDSEFSEKWGLKIEERELTLEERYNKWFNNNYETGMERYFDPNDLPDYNDPYYNPTPTKVITVTYQGEKIEVYE